MASDVAAYGFENLVSLLTPLEEIELGLIDEERWCGAAGIRYISLPIPDRGLPDRRKLLALGQLLLDSAGRVGIHCRAGIGRSALVAASVLVLEGTPPRQALDRVERARACPIPDTDEQRDFVLCLNRPEQDDPEARAILDSW